MRKSKSSRSIQSLQIANAFSSAGGGLDWQKRPSLTSYSPKTRRMKSRFLQ